MKKVALISLDAVSQTEFERLKKLDNFKRFFEDGVYCQNSLSVYPTQTYTVHSSVITGNYPSSHGIYNNQFFQPFKEEKNKEWFWYRNQIKTNTLYDSVRMQKGKVCSILWPVTGKAKIKYNIPEIVAVNDENQAVKVLKNSSVFFALRCELKYGNIRKGISQPQLDEFAKTCAIDCIERHSPELIMLHLVCVDSAKHNYGVESEMIDESLKHLDRMLGEVFEACGDDYTFVMFSDHGQFTVEKDVYINAFLQEQGLLDFECKKYDAYIECMGGSGIVRAKNAKTMQKTLELLEANKDYLGIEDIYKRDMLDKLHMSDEFEYIIEAKSGYHLKEKCSEEVVKTLKDENITYATHGYSPLKEGYRCVFFAMGKCIKHGVEIKEMEVVDIAPTVAKIMGIDDFECEGKVLDEIFD